MNDRYRVSRWDGTHRPDANELRSVMAAEGYDVYEWSDAAGMTYDRHQHSTDQSHWIVSGALELDVQGVGKVILNAGDRDFMPANTYHSARAIGSEPVVYLIGEKR